MPAPEPATTTDGSFARALAFERRMHEAAARRVEPLAYGVAYLADDLPRVYDQNFLWVQGEQDVTADALIDDAERLHAAAGQAHRRLVIDHEPLWRALAAPFATAGWRQGTEVFMARTSEPDRIADTADVREITRDELEPAVASYYGAEAWGGDPETRRQLVEHGRRMADAAGGERRFGIVQGERTIAYCKLWEHRGVAQIEDVVVLAEHRGSGHGRAVVTAALLAALADDPALVFIVADDQDWPKELYERLGFTPVGRTRILDRLPP